MEQRPLAGLTPAIALVLAVGGPECRAAGPDAEPATALQAAYGAAMQGRKADALAAAQRLSAGPSLERVIAIGGSGWELCAQYAVLVRFGLWDELIALGRPDGRAPGLTAGYLYGRGVALAARGRLDEARAVLAELEGLPAREPRLRAVVEVAAPIVAARIAASESQDDAAIAALTRAVAAEDRLPAGEPAAWFFPVRHVLGAELLIARRSADAERVYAEDLKLHPGNAWALYGLAAAERAAGHARAAAVTERKFASAWKHADVRMEASAFWFAGPDTTSCECQRQPSGHR